MSESSFRSRVVKALKPLHGFAVENPCLPGTPDVNCTAGWIELKWLAHWPARAGTPVRIPHYTPQQRLFAAKRAKAGGRCFLMLQVESEQETLLLDGVTAAMMIDSAARTKLCDASIAHWRGREMDKNLVSVLSTPPL